MKKGKILLILILAIVLMVTGLILIKQFVPKEESEAVDENLVITDYDPETAVSLNIVYDSYDYTLEKQSDGSWTCQGFKPELDAAVILNTLDRACRLTAANAVTESEDISESDFGLDDPEITITVILEDGTEFTHRIGMQNPITGEYYLTSTAKDGIYLASKTFRPFFNHGVTYYAVAEVLPDMTGTQITSIEFDRPEGNVDKYIFYPDGNDHIYNYSEPWSYIAEDGTEYILNSYPFSSDLYSLVQYYFSGAICYDPTEAELESYGMTEPQGKVTYTYEAINETGITGETSILLGNAADENHAYVMIEGGTFIYRMSNSEIVRLRSGLAPREYINPAALSVDVDSISSVELYYEGKCYVVDYTVSTEKNADGIDVTTRSYSMNGTDFDEQAAYYYELFINTIRTTYADVIDLEPNEFDDSSYVAKVVVHRNTDRFNTLTLTFYDYDGSFCIADFEGQRILEFDKNTIHNWASKIPDLYSIYY